jgi:outer membrane protein
MVLGTLSATAHAKDLLDAYHDAQRGDAQLQSAAYQRDAAVEARPQALAALLPQLSAGADLQQQREAVPLSQQTTGGLAAGPAYGTVRGLTLSLSQTVWDLGSFNRLKEANAQVAQAESSYRSEQQRLILRVAQAYFAILSAADQLSTNRSEREAFGALLHQAQVREQTGLGPRSDVEQAQSFYDATEEPVIDADNALEDARRALAQITGIYRGATAPLQSEIPLLAPSPASPEDWATAAREENFEVRAAQFRADAAWREIAVQRARHWPTLALQTTANHQQQPDVFGGRDDVDSVGLALNWPLYQGGAIASAVRQAQAGYLQARADLETLRRDAERQTRAAFRGVTTGVERVRATQRAADSSRAAVEASRRNIEFGTGSEFDLLNAQTNFYAAVRAFQQSRYDYLTALLSLKQQAGRLTEDDLAAIDRLLAVPEPGAGGGTAGAAALVDDGLSPSGFSTGFSPRPSRGIAHVP